MKSNCLIEALRAKIKDPKNVRIYHFPLALNNNYLHFYWVNKRENKVYHYADPKAGNCCLDRFKLLFTGKLKIRQRDLFERSLYKKMSSLGWTLDKQITVAKKLDFRWQNPNLID